jgi:hypothetical protein
MQGIVIQGPTYYVNEILQIYKDVKNVVWSTWDDEPQENLNMIESSNIVLITSPKPIFPGYLNINLQTLSTIKGINYLESKKIVEILKIRSDIKPIRLNILMSLLKGKPLSLMAICKPDVRPLYYELVYEHSSFDFPVDLVLYGNISNMKNLFNFTTDEIYPIPPESLIMYNLFLNMGVEFNLNYDYLLENNIDFFLQDCLDNNVDFLWLKRNNESLINMHQDKNLYNY